MSEDFEHRVRLDSIAHGKCIELAATEAERAAIAERLRLASLDRFEAHAVLERDGAEVRAKGRIRAALQQRCVATVEPVEEYVDEAFEIVFLPAPKDGARDEEVELAPEDCDVVFYDGQAIELGTAVADTLALAMEPYPRSPGAESALEEAGVLSEEQAGPFAALAKLKRGSDEG